MKQKNDAGFSLIEVLVAITLLAAIVVPTCSSLIMSFRMNAKTEKMLQAQLAVSSAVETLMAKGIPVDYDNLKDANYQTKGDGEWWKTLGDQFPEVEIVIDPKEDGLPYYNVTVTSKDDTDVKVTTTIRASASEVTEEKSENGGTS